MSAPIFIVFLPLLAAIVAGLGNRMIGNFAAKLITTGACSSRCVLSWPIFLGFLMGSQHAAVYPVLSWIHSGDLNVDWALSVDSPDRGDAGGGHDRLGARPPL